MEFTLDEALQKGIEAHKAGKAQETDRYYTAILKVDPKHPDALNNLQFSYNFMLIDSIQNNSAFVDKV